MQPALHPLHAAPTASPRINRRLILYIILVVALLPRLYHINQPYTDLAGWRESSVAMMAHNFQHRNPNILYPEISWNGPGETYTGYEFQTVSYTASLLYRVFGQHEWIGRLVAVFFGVWGVFALYQLVRRIWDEDHALVSAAVMALLPGVIYFDRSFLPDPVMVSLVTTGLWLFVAYLQTDARRYFVLALFTACLGFLTKITGMIVLLPTLYAVLVILEARQKRTVSTLVKLAVPALGVVGIVAAYYLWARHVGRSYPPYIFAGHSNWVWDEGLGAWLRQGYFLDKTAYIFTHWILGRPFFFLFLTGIFTSVFYIKTQKNKQGGLRFSAPYFFHFWLAGYLFFYSIGAKEQIDNFWNFHIGDPMMAAFCSSALLFAWNVLKSRKWAAIGAGLLLFAYVLRWDWRVMRNTFVYKPYESDHRMGLQLRKFRQPDDLVVVLPHDIGSPIAVFYSGGRGWVFPPHEKPGSDRLPPTDAACIALLEELRGKGADWFGINGNQYKTIQASYPQFAQYLNTRYLMRAQEADCVIFQLQPAKAGL